MCVCPLITVVGLDIIVVFLQSIPNDMNRQCLRFRLELIGSICWE